MVTPVGPLMIEHRLIERMILQMKKQNEKFETDEAVDLVFIDTAVDFIRNYADKCHHGKEEDILFRDLKQKGLSEEHNRIMNELIQEHIYGRQTTGKLVDARNAFIQGKKEALKTIIETMKELMNFYPKHIEKEDRHFFLPIMRYFTKEEQNAMLHEEYEFDREFIHNLYKRMVEKIEKEASS